MFSDCRQITDHWLVDTNGGDAILVLASNAIHFLWKWPKDLNSGGVVNNDMLYNSFLLDFSSLSFRNWNWSDSWSFDSDDIDWMQATPKVHPNLWKPRSGLELMNNDVPSTNSEEGAMSCFDLSKNDSYLISPTRGMISIFEYLQRWQTRSEKRNLLYKTNDIQVFEK